VYLCMRIRTCVTYAYVPMQVRDLFGKGGALEPVWSVAGSDSHAICDLIAQGLDATEGCPWVKRPKLSTCIEVMQRVYQRLSEPNQYYDLPRPSKSSLPSELTKAWRSWKMAQALRSPSHETVKLKAAYDALNSQATTGTQAEATQLPGGVANSAQPPNATTPPVYRPWKVGAQLASRVPPGASHVASAPHSSQASSGVQ